MRCPKCGAPETRVIETRNAEEGKVVRRRRECPVCDVRFTTYERLEDWRPLCVVKKDGRRESFDREKLLHGLVRACEKLSVPLESLEAAVDRIEDRLRQGGGGEFSSTLVGEYAMEELRSIHKVAYVRFASVYREFTDLANFDEEIRRLASD
jgi:transcriptional repressor NrdR